MEALQCHVDRVRRITRRRCGENGRTPRWIRKELREEKEREGWRGKETGMEIDNMRKR